MSIVVFVLPKTKIRSHSGSKKPHFTGFPIGVHLPSGRDPGPQAGKCERTFALRRRKKKAPVLFRTEALRSLCFCKEHERFIPAVLLPGIKVLSKNALAF